MRITIGSLFDGIGGFPLAGLRNGMTTLWASEIEPFPIRVTKLRFPDTKHLGDITKINGAEIEPVDIITFGSPCQDLSVAGKRAGLAGERSGLFMEAIRIIREMREHEQSIGRTNINIRPRFAVWENVPGAFSSNKGEDFRAVLEETARVADETVTIPRPPKCKWNTSGAIMGDGWSIAWRVLDAQYWGVPQRRRRIFLVADFGGQSAPEILFKRKSLSRHLKKSGEAREGAATDVERSADETSKFLTPWDVQSRRIHEASGKWPALYGGEGGGHGYAAIPNTTVAVRTGQTGVNGIGVADDVTHTLDCANAQAVVISLVNRGHYREDGIAETLRSESHGDLPCILDMSHACDVIRDCGQVVPALQHRMGTGGNQVPLTYQKVTGPLMANSHPESYSGQDAYSDMLVTPYQKTVGALCAADCKGMQAQMGAQDKYIVGQQYSVRRLTPLECERLQDYPDGWTDIEGASDSGRYKALGNSVAVCCPEYVLEGIKEVIERGQIC